jgi:hypothetical protein
MLLWWWMEQGKAARTSFPTRPPSSMDLCGQNDTDKLPTLRIQGRRRRFY